MNEKLKAYSVFFQKCLKWKEAKSSLRLKEEFPLQLQLGILVLVVESDFCYV